MFRAQLMPDFYHNLSFNSRFSQVETRGHVLLKVKPPVGASITRWVCFCCCSLLHGNRRGQLKYIQIGSLATESQLV